VSGGRRAGAPGTAGDRLGEVWKVHRVCRSGRRCRLSRPRI